MKESLVSQAKEMNLQNYIINDTLQVLVKPNSKQTEILFYNNEKKAVVIAVAAPPENNKANKEVIKFVSKLLKKRVLIKSGASSKQKILKVLSE